MITPTRPSKACEIIRFWTAWMRDSPCVRFFEIRQLNGEWFEIGTDAGFSRMHRGQAPGHPSLPRFRPGAPAGSVAPTGLSREMVCYPGFRPRPGGSRRTSPVAIFMCSLRERARLGRSAHFMRVLGRELWFPTQAAKSAAWMGYPALGFCSLLFQKPNHVIPRTTRPTTRSNAGLL